MHLKTMYNYFNISNETTLDEVKKQYHRLAMETHPDKGGSLEAFREVNEEYRKALEMIQKRAYRSNDANLYQLINEQLVSIDGLINKLNVPDPLKPAISYLVEKGINNLGKALNQKLQEFKA